LIQFGKLKKNILTLPTIEADLRAGVQEPEHSIFLLSFFFFCVLSASLLFYYHVQIHPLGLKEKEKERRDETKRNETEFQRD
jgi:hypothetical protein